MSPTVRTPTWCSERPSGRPLDPDTPSQPMPKLIEQYNRANPGKSLRRISLHDLRHVHATTLLLAGEPVHVVAVRLGHADPSVTLRVYAHVIQDLTPAVLTPSLGPSGTPENPNRPLRRRAAVSSGVSIGFDGRPAVVKTDRP